MGKKCFVGTLLLLASFIPTQAFEVKITSNTNTLNINEYLNLTIEIISDDTEEEEIKEVNIAWIERFDIVSKSQSQTSGKSISVVNWKAETVSKSVNSINLTLSPKEEGEFIIGPVIAVWENETKETETINIKVEWKKQINNNIADIQEIIDNWAEKASSTKELPDKYTIYSLIFLVLVLVLIAASILFFKQKSDVSLEYENEEDKEDKEEFNEKKEDFEKEENIIYPSLDDENFVNKIEEILLSKISKKYNIKNIKNKSYDEILENLDDNLAAKNLIRNSWDKIQKLKYSNILISKAELLDLIKQI